MHKLTSALGLLVVLTASHQPMSGAFTTKDSDGQSLHGKMVKEALSSTIDPPNLGLVIKCLDQKEAEKDSQQSLKSMVAFVDREQKKILNYAAEADVSPASRYRCLKHLGELLCVAQDFYSRTDYLEMQAAKIQQKNGKAAFDPFDIELVDWSKMLNATKQNEPIIYSMASGSKEDAAQGKAALANTTLYKAARELAVRETTRQWEVLETLIKQRYHEKAITILAALKQASCPATEPDEIE